MLQNSINILYVDDEPENLRAFKASFRRDFSVVLAESVDQGMEVLKKSDIHIVLTDQRMPNKTGVEFLREISKDYPDVMRILVTGYSDINVVKEAINDGNIFKYIEKPWNNEKMKNVILKAYEIYELKIKSKEKTQELAKANEQLEFMLRQKLIS